MKRKANNIILEFTHEQAELFMEAIYCLKDNYSTENSENAICQCFKEAFSNSSAQMNKTIN